MDQCSKHDTPPAFSAVLTNRSGHVLRLELETQIVVVLTDSGSVSSSQKTMTDTIRLLTSPGSRCVRNTSTFRVLQRQIPRRLSSRANACRANHPSAVAHLPSYPLGQIQHLRQRDKTRIVNGVSEFKTVKSKVFEQPNAENTRRERGHSVSSGLGAIQYQISATPAMRSTARKPTWPMATLSDDLAMAQ